MEQAVNDMIVFCFVVGYIFLLIGVNWAAGLMAFFGLCFYAMKYGGDGPTTNQQQQRDETHDQ